MQQEVVTKKTTYLLTGGAGFIGSHTAIELYAHLRSKHGNRTSWQIIILDNFSNAAKAVVTRVESILQKDFPEDTAPFFALEQVDIQDSQALKALFSKYATRNEAIDCIIHFAAKKAVGESVQLPLDYYENNVIGTLNLLRCMEAYNCRDFIFSSSATVYGCGVGVTEESKFSPDNPYGRTKVCVEFILKDFARARKDTRILTLRYFNPCGAHSSGLIGDAPSVFPNNLFPFIEQVAIGKRECLNIFGNDYNTPDGTGVRDYLHVVDLAKGHVACLARLDVMSGIAKNSIYKNM
jgi:UDP-glucose 4-epimerase